MSIRKTLLMKLNLMFCWLVMIIGFGKAESQENSLKETYASIDYVEALKDTLSSLADNTDDEFFRMHCNSILAVVNSKYSLDLADSAFLVRTYNAFMNMGDPANAQNMSTYLLRKRPLIISWVSPTDGAVSFSWLTLPKDWNPENMYPLYINLHGLWSVAGNSIEYMTYPYLQPPSTSTSFEDGYLLSPWGRGNMWYKDISETDIWECMAALENIADIDPDRKYLSGHSMGGYGAWSIARKSPGTWAALGIMAGALWYYPNVLDDVAAQALKDMPTYFVCGTNDALLEINKFAYQMLKDVGNWHLQFVTFSGGHEYLEKNVKNMYLWMRQYSKEEMTTGKRIPDGNPQPGFAIRCNPNPVSGNSNIVLSSKDHLSVDISIYDLSGRFICDIAKGVLVSGEHIITFNASGLKSGIYIVRMESGNRVAETKMAVIY